MYLGKLAMRDEEECRGFLQSGKLNMLVHAMVSFFRVRTMKRVRNIMWRGFRKFFLAWFYRRPRVTNHFQKNQSVLYVPSINLCLNNNCVYNRNTESPTINSNSSDPSNIAVILFINITPESQWSGEIVLLNRKMDLNIKECLILYIL